MSLKPSFYFLILLLFSCKEQSPKQQQLPDPSTRKYLLNLGLYYGQVKSITQISEGNKDREDITETFEWLDNGRVVKRRLQNASYYSLAFLDSNYRIDSIVFYGLNPENTNNIFHKTPYYEDYRHYETGKIIDTNTTAIEIDTIGRIIKKYYKNSLNSIDYFDTAGFLIRSDSKTGRSITTYIYNDHGFCSSAHTTFTDDTKGYRKLKTSYEYDSLGNWIKKTDRLLMTDIGRDEKSVWRRKIVYRE